MRPRERACEGLLEIAMAGGTVRPACCSTPRSQGGCELTLTIAVAHGLPALASRPLLLTVLVFGKGFYP